MIAESKFASELPERVPKGQKSISVQRSKIIKNHFVTEIIGIESRCRGILFLPQHA